MCWLPNLECRSIWRSTPTMQSRRPVSPGRSGLLAPVTCDAPRVAPIAVRWPALALAASGNRINVPLRDPGSTCSAAGKFECRLDSSRNRDLPRIATSILDDGFRWDRCGDRGRPVMVGRPVPRLRRGLARAAPIAGRPSQGDERANQANVVWRGSAQAATATVPRWSMGLRSPGAMGGARRSRLTTEAC